MKKTISNLIKSTGNKFAVHGKKLSNLISNTAYKPPPPEIWRSSSQPAAQSIFENIDEKANGYRVDPVAFQCVNLIANAIASIPLHIRKRHATTGGKDYFVESEHPMANLISKPNVHTSSYEFMSNIAAQLLIYGDAFLLMTGINSNRELQIVHPSKVEYLADEDDAVIGYQILSSNGKNRRYFIDQINGNCEVLHIKGLNPNNSLSSISPMSVALSSISLRQETRQWSQSLLRNGARLSAAILVKGGVGSEPLTEEQFIKLKAELDDCLREGGGSRPMIIDSPNRDIEWRQIGMSPKDYDCNETRDMASLEVALSFGVPFHLIGGIRSKDNSYQNMKESRMTLWEQTVMPLADKILANLNGWTTFSMLDPMAEICYDENDISALASKRDSVWNRVKDADFLSNDERRCLVGLPALNVKTGGL